MASLTVGQHEPLTRQKEPDGQAQDVLQQVWPRPGL
jgi:hypothetical protein